MYQLAFSNLLLLHRNKLLLLAGVVVLLLGVEISYSDTKALHELDAWDIIGEGAAMSLALMWALVVLASRINGKVTNLLFSGLSCFFVATLQDLMDEFLILETIAFWHGMVESAPAPIGMILISWGLLLWHREQQMINQQLAKKERFYREHSAVDYVTGLYRAEYMERELSRELVVSRRLGQPLSVMMLDIDQFDRFNQRYGDLEGDRLLRQLAELVVMNLRVDDLACRYAGDRFIVLLPNCSQREADVLAEQIEQSVQTLAYKPTPAMSAEFHTLQTGIATAATLDSAGGIIDRANRALELKKEHQKKRTKQVAA